MAVKGALQFKGLSDWLEDFASAGRDVDGALTELLTEVQPFVAEEMERNLHKTSEQWTPALALTIEVSNVQRDGNFIFLEVTAGGANQAAAAHAKEFGTARQAAEPFFRPTFRGHLLKNRLKATMKTLAEQYGVK